MGKITLGPRVERTARPTFLAVADNQTLVIGLDSSAIMMLTDGTLGEDQDAILEVRRGVIRQAAQRLYDRGFCSKTNERIEILISRLDLEGDA